MEWVETTGKTVEEAKDAALDQLGVDEQDAEFDVVEEPRTGLFGRTRGEARVRARVRPTQPRPKVERRDRRGRSGKSGRPNDKRKSGGSDRSPAPAKAAAAAAATSVVDGDAGTGVTTDEPGSAPAAARTGRRWCRTRSHRRR